MHCPEKVFTGQKRCLSLGHGAFALIELLVVIALILVLTTLYWRSNTGGSGDKTRASCRNQLQRIYMAMQIYANEFGGKYPVATQAATSEAAFALLVPKYTVDTASFICPGSKDDPVTAATLATSGRISYAYFMGRKAESPEPLASDRLVDTLSKASGQAVFSRDGKPPANNHGKEGGNFLFGDGRTESIPAVGQMSYSTGSGVVLLNPRP